MQSHAAKNAKIMLGPYVLALIDLLGQSSELAKWNQLLPQEPDRDDPRLQAVRNTYGRVLKWRERFEEVFTEWENHHESLAHEHSIGKPADQRRMYDEYRENTLHHAHFSDSLIFYSQLQNKHEHWQVRNVTQMVVTSGLLMLAAMCDDKSVLRGAIEVGMLTRFPTGDPYGPALAEAHRLESKFAEYPRILVGPSLLSYLTQIEGNPAGDSVSRVNKGYATECRKYLAQDADGHCIVDYLGDAFANTAGNPGPWRQLQSDAYRFVQHELVRFNKEGNEKLIKRYERLQAYFGSRGSK